MDETTMTTTTTLETSSKRKKPTISVTDAGSPRHKRGSNKDTTPRVFFTDTNEDTTQDIVMDNGEVYCASGCDVTGGIIYGIIEYKCNRCGKPIHGPSCAERDGIAWSCKSCFAEQEYISSDEFSEEASNSDSESTQSPDTIMKVDETQQELPELTDSPTTDNDLPASPTKMRIERQHDDDSKKDV